MGFSESEECEVGLCNATLERGKDLLKTIAEVERLGKAGAAMVICARGYIYFRV